MILPAKHAKEREGRFIFRVLSHISRAAVLLFTLNVLAEATVVGAPPPIRPLKQSPLSPEEELAAKRKRARNAIPPNALHQPHFGLTMVSCERGDIRQSPDGLLVYSERGREEIALPADQSPRDLVMAEFADAIAGKPTTHTGRWGLANLEVCTAAIESSRTGKEIELKHQVAVA